MTRELNVLSRQWDFALRLFFTSRRDPVRGNVGEGHGTTSLLINVALLVTLVGCKGVPGERGEQGSPGDVGTQGTMGTQGARGEVGPAGPRGPAAPHVAWVDASGNDVPGIVGTDPVYFDNSGTLWTIDVHTLQVTPYGNGTNLRIAYTTSDCTGELYVSNLLRQLPPPRVPFRLSRDNSVRTVRDGAAATIVRLCAFSDAPGVCSSLGECVDAPALFETMTMIVQIPALAATPPVHPELRE